MHGATADAPPQVFTFPRRPPNAEGAKDGAGASESGSESESERGDNAASAADDERAAVAAAATRSPSSSSKKKDSDINGGGDDTSMAAVSGSHAGSDRAVFWSLKVPATG